MDFSEKWGNSVENAVELALIDLRLTREEVEVIVLEEPSKGFFGIGSKLAKVRVEKKQEKAKEIIKEKPFVKQVEKTYEKPFVKPAEKTYEKVEVKKPAERFVNKREENKPRIQDGKFDSFKSDLNKPVKEQKPRQEINFEGLNSEKPENLVTVKEDNKVLIFLKEITEKMGLDLEIVAQENDDIIFVDMEGKDSGTIIGKRGQTLDAIQYLASLVANKGDGKYIKVVVDAENYRKKREKTLELLANRLASKVTKSRKSVRLEPMNPYERKVIHATLQSNPEVTTRSEGEEPYRRVIIDLK